MDILLDIVHSVDYGVLAYISEHWRGGLSDTVWKVFSLMGSYGAVWITLAVLLLFFRRTRRAGAAMLIARCRLSAWQRVPQEPCHAAASICHPHRPDGAARSGGPVVVSVRSHAQLVCGSFGAVLFPP